MSDAENDLLGRELGKLGIKGAKLGAALAGISMPETAAGRGTAMGPSLVAGYLPTERFRTELVVTGHPATVLKRVAAFFSRYGRIIGDEEAGHSPYPKISGVIGSGLLRMNPTVVHVELVAADASGCTLAITAAAKEGLIKQRTAEKAVYRTVAALRA